MDGNRRWAKKRLLPAAFGHASGAKRVRSLVEACIRTNIPHLSLFAFSTENWRRPPEEVSVLMNLFASYLQKEVDDMEKNGSVEEGNNDYNRRGQTSYSGRKFR